MGLVGLGVVLTVAWMHVVPAQAVAPPPSACAVEAAAAVPEPPTGVFGDVSTIRAAWTARHAAAALLVCEIDAGTIDSILVTRDGLLVATFKDASVIEFSIEPGEQPWLIAHAAEHGVVLHTADTPVFPSGPESRPGTSRTSPLGIITLAVVVVTTIMGIVWYRRRRPSKVAVSGVVDRARVRRADVPATRFSDVAGCAEAIEDLREIVDVLTHPDRYTNLGARVPKGALLVGPPGTGKTLLAKAVAGEAGVPFFSAAGSDFVEMYVGVGAKRVRDVFERAKKADAAIVFIDEIDAVGRRRSSTSATGGEQEHENTLVALLNELDGFRASNVVVLAATNRPEILDAALTRPGRLDRKVHVGLPDVVEREAILGVHARGKRFDAAVSFAAIARRTPGMSGAQLEQVCNEAALLAARAGAEVITEAHLHAAVEYVAIGRARRSATVSAHDRTITAWHEAGHAVAAMKTPSADRPVAVSIVPRGATGGATWTAPEDSQLLTRRALHAKLVVALAGRAAEERLLDGEFTAGAANDLQVATEIARAMVERFGMTDLGLVVHTTSSADSTAAADRLLRTAFDEARTTLAAHAELLEKIVEHLLAHDDCTAADLARLDDSVATVVPA